MAQSSSIEWTEATWNPTTGCTKVSHGCTNCYAERMAFRLKAMGQPRYKDGFKLTLQDDVVDLPLRWKKPRVIFVNSMSGDTFKVRGTFSRLGSNGSMTTKFTLPSHTNSKTVRFLKSSDRRGSAYSSPPPQSKQTFASSTVSKSSGVFPRL